MSKNEIRDFWLRFSSRYPEFSFNDLDLVVKIKRLWLKHQRLALDSVNKGNTEKTYKEMDMVENKIIALVKGKRKYSVEFQGDPRGATVRLLYKNTAMDWNAV